MKLIIITLVLVSLAGCSTTGTSYTRMNNDLNSQVSQFRPDSDRLANDSMISVPICKFFPFSVPIDDAIKWVGKKLPGRGSPPTPN